MTAETFWERWDREARERHTTEVADGKHDGECEWRERSHMCHCHKRKRIADGFTEPPILHYEYPVCGQCWGHVSHDGDNFTCGTCRVSWTTGDDREVGTFMDDYGDLSWPSVYEVTE